MQKRRPHARNFQRARQNTILVCDACMHAPSPIRAFGRKPDPPKLALAMFLIVPTHPLAPHQEGNNQPLHRRLDDAICTLPTYAPVTHVYDAGLSCSHIRLRGNLHSHGPKCPAKYQAGTMSAKYHPRSVITLTLSLYGTFGRWNMQNARCVELPLIV